MTYLAHALVEPLLKLFALICIIDQAGHWLEDDVHASKALKEGSKFDFETKYRVQGGETNEDERRGCLCRAQRQVLLSVA